MSCVNKVILIGNVGRDPEIRVTQSGMRIANLSLATTEKRKAEEVTEWHRLVAFDKTAGVIEDYVTKGTKLYVEGRLQTREWLDQAQQKHYTTEVLVDRLLMLGGKPKQVVDTPPGAAGPPFNDEIPF